MNLRKQEDGMTNDKRYREAVRWIAGNDEPDDLRVRDVKWYVTTGLVADVFGKTTEQVAKAVVRHRKRYERG